VIEVYAPACSWRGITASSRVPCRGCMGASLSVTVLDALPRYLPADAASQTRITFLFRKLEASSKIERTSLSFVSALLPAQLTQCLR
jgi:hypothetical protein